MFQTFSALPNVPSAQEMRSPQLSPPRTGASVQGLNVDRVDIGDGERAALKNPRELRLVKDFDGFGRRSGVLAHSGAGADDGGKTPARHRVDQVPRNDAGDAFAAKLPGGREYQPSRGGGERPAQSSERPVALVKVHQNSGGKGAPAALVVSARHETRGTELRASYPAVNENPREPVSIHGLRVALAA